MKTSANCAPSPVALEAGAAFRAVICATDFSSAALGAGRYAALLARHYDADLILVHGFTLSHPAMEAETLGHVHSVQRNNLEHQLSAVADRLALRGKTITVLGEGEPSAVVRQVAAQHCPSLVVLSTHSTSALQRHLVGSVAEGILRSFSTPVLTVGPHVAVPNGNLVLRRILCATDFSPAALRAASYAAEMARAFDCELDMLHIIRNEHKPTRRQVSTRSLTESDTSQSVARLRTCTEVGDVRGRVLSHARESGADLIVLGAHHHSILAMHLRTGPAFRIILEATCPVLTIGEAGT